MSFFIIYTRKCTHAYIFIHKRPHICQQTYSPRRQHAPTPYKASTLATTPATPAKRAPVRGIVSIAAFVAVDVAVAVAVAVIVDDKEEIEVTALAVAPAEAVSLSAPAVMVTGNIMLAYPESTVWELKMAWFSDETTAVQVAMSAEGSSLQFWFMVLYMARMGFRTEKSRGV